MPRIVGIDLPHHITQRGNYRQRIFEDIKDYQKHISFIETESYKYKADIIAYCLMPNHVHFIVIPHLPESLAIMFKYTHMKCSQYFNKKKKERGRPAADTIFIEKLEKKIKKIVNSKGKRQTKEK